MSDRLHVATRKGLFALKRGANGQWSIERSAFVGDNVTLIERDPRDGAMYAALDHGHFGVKLQRSRDDGATWAECGTPAYPEQPEGAEPEVNSMGQKIPWSLKLIWSLTPGGADEPGVLWCGTAPGGLFRSNDSGDSWAMVRTLWDDDRRKEWFGGGLDWPAIHSICLDPRDAKRLVVGVSCGGVWETTDGGETWDTRSDGLWAAYMPPERKHDPDIQDPHIIAMCPADPDVMWIQHHNGMFKTEDGGKKWLDLGAVKPSNFGFAVVAHPTDPKTAWFVPAVKDEQRVPVDGRFVVTRTRDGGKSFDVLSSGLPDRHAYDIVFRHSLDVDSSGDRLAMGSTTGSLWCSDDGGDQWTCVTAHLPPIHCVRFEK